MVDVGYFSDKTNLLQANDKMAIIWRKSDKKFMQFTLCMQGKDNDCKVVRTFIIAFNFEFFFIRAHFVWHFGQSEMNKRWLIYLIHTIFKLFLNIYISLFVRQMMHIIHDFQLSMLFNYLEYWMKTICTVYNLVWPIRNVSSNTKCKFNQQSTENFACNLKLICYWPKEN